MTDYCASKFGAVGFTESLRQDLSTTHIHVSTIYPGLIDTGMFSGVEHQFPWLTPPLDPKKLAVQIADVMGSGRGQDLKLPFYVNLVPLLRLFPIEFSDWIRHVSWFKSHF